LRRFNQRQGFLVSAAIHLTLLMILISHPPTPRKPDEIDLNSLERKQVVFLPPAAVLRKILPHPPPAARPAPTPPPSKPAQEKKDRISIGPPSDLRTKGPLILHRDDDLTKVPKGERVLPAPAPPMPSPQAAAKAVASAPAAAQDSETPGKPGLRLPPGLVDQLSRGDEGSRSKPASLGESADEAAEVVARRMARDARLGLPTGNGQNQAGLYFDPQGADFTLWINHFKNEVYRNWIVPQSVLLGFRGHVDFEFTVERDGSISALRLVKSSGTPSLDRAAQQALTSSRFMNLPDDYGPPRVTMQVTFFYNEAPQGS
jgi:TonB family protein